MWPDWAEACGLSPMQLELTGDATWQLAIGSLPDDSVLDASAVVVGFALPQPTSFLPSTLDHQPGHGYGHCAPSVSFVRSSGQHHVRLARVSFARGSGLDPQWDMETSLPGAGARGWQQWPAPFARLSSGVEECGFLTWLPGERRRRARKLLSVGLERTRDGRSHRGGEVSGTGGAPAESPADTGVSSDGGASSDNVKTNRRGVAVGVSYSGMSRTQARAVLSALPVLDRAGIGALAGALAGGLTNAVLHPIDTVKTKLQTKGAHQVYRGAWDVVRKVLATQGIPGFYGGLPAAVAGSIPSSAIYFGTYEMAKGLCFTHIPAAHHRLLVPPLAAALGNVASSAILVPKELIKTRLQTGAQGGTWALLWSIIQSEGVAGLYAGYSASLLRNVPSNVINFSVFEYLKSLLQARTSRAVLQPWQNLAAGAVSGMLSAAATTPLDVVKTRLMTQARRAVITAGVASGPAAEAAAKAQLFNAFTVRGVGQALQQIAAEEGGGALFRGLGTRLVYSGCFSAVGFLSFEMAKVLLLQEYLKLKERDGKKGKGKGPRPTDVRTGAVASNGPATDIDVGGRDKASWSSKAAANDDFQKHGRIDRST